MSLKNVALETMEIIDRGGYTAPSGAWVPLGESARRAVEDTRLYAPQELEALLRHAGEPGGGLPRVEVTGETTQVAAHRLFTDEGVDDVLALNFASARNPGGGFASGAKAQEEDVCRCSALYPCLAEQWEYYEYNRGRKTLLYSDYMIYSPRVPFFRTRSRNLVEAPYFVSVITAPAPNAGQVLRRDPDAGPEIERVMRQRVGKVLAIARAHQHRHLVLGAWGCGVFRNAPEMVADAFATWLEEPRFSGAFDRVVFAVYDRSKAQLNRRAFEARFSA